MQDLPPAALALVAAYFQALAEPTRLQALNFLRGGERRVGEIAEHCGCTQANMSRHLTLLGKQGLVARTSRGTSAFYRIADEATYALCDLVCHSVGRRLQDLTSERAAFAPAPAAPAQRKQPR
ncbi:MAG: winged helix-turn-helix transcriptional regulator [Pseudomonadota bacterium]|nr:winged helix-turn-helix transcriptional regulator [Pseudomonadota bacterium]